MEIKHVRMKQDDLNKLSELGDDYLTKYTQTLWKEIVAKDDEHTRQLISEYAMKRSQEIGEKISVAFIDKEMVDEIIEMGIQEYMRKHR